MSGGLFPKVSNFVNKNLGLDTGLTSALGSSDFFSKPWGKNPGSDVFFPTPEIEGDRWDKLYPYRLIVYDVSKNAIVNGLSGSSSNKVETQFLRSGVDYVLSQATVSNKWIYQLPITPQQIQIVDQYAIGTTATARGVTEEHNGVKFKTIALEFTTGIWPLRPSTGAGISSPSTLGSIFGGTLQAAQNLNQSLSKVKSAFTGDKLGSAQKSELPPLDQTGYYQAEMLGYFIERYTQEKKKPQNKNWRLVLDMPKMNVSYVVSPVSLVKKKSVQSPNETTFSLQLKAWKRVNINATKAPERILTKLSPNDFQKIVNTIRETRRALANSINLLKAVRSDFQTPLEALRQTALAVKDLGGLAFTAADLPGQIINDYKTSISDSLNIIKNSFKRGAESQGNSSSVKINSASLKLDSQQVKSAFIADALSAQENAYEGLSLAQVQSGDLGADASQSSALNPVNALFDSPEGFFEILDSVDINALSLSPDQQTRIDDEIQSASLINIDNLNSFKAVLLDTALLISNNYGAGDPLYSSIYGRQPPKERVTPLTVEETEIITSIYEAIQVYDILTSSGFFDTLRTVNAMEYVGGLANQAGIDFDQTEGKILVPVPFGLTIEQIAARYLKDANKWLEIVTINKLRLPYIDEEGFFYPLLSNGSGRQINVDDSERRLYIGQFLILSSNTTPPFKRKIINVERISDDNYLVTLDGEDDLDNLTTLQAAKIKGYLPGTINSQNQIFIPSDDTPQEDDLITTPRIFDADKLVKISKVDWLLDENGDVAINEVGDIQLAGGLTNLIQALKLKIRTKKGTLLQHLDYGLGVNAGISIADIESGEIIQSLNKMIENDSRFDGVERLNIRLNGGILSIDMSVRIANGSGVLPITFEV